MLLSNEMKDIIQGFFSEKIIQISVNPLFKLASGKEAPLYLDHRKIFSHPKLRKQVLTAWATLLKDESVVTQAQAKNTLVFAGTATAGIAPAYALAEQFSAGFVYVRNKPKEHGLKSTVEGFLPPHAQIVLVDDMVTTGSSVLQALDNVRQENANVTLVTSISRHDFKKTAAAFANKHVSITSLFKTKFLFETARTMNLLTAHEMSVVNAWLNQLDSE